MSVAYAAKEGIRVGVKTGALDAIMGASPVVQLTLLVLVGMSVISWTIIFAKRRQINHINQANNEFLDFFWKARSLDEVHSKIETFKTSSVAHVFKAGFLELQRIADSPLSMKVPAFAAQENQNKGTPRLIGLDNLHRALRKSSDIEIALLESRLNFLATTGSTGPFIGLFGTVWGIMTAFQQIGATGSASLAVVAPGISEALITTAIGLAAAIPAVVAYNHFLSQVKKQELEVSNFTSDFLNIVKRNFFKDE